MPEYLLNEYFLLSTSPVNTKYQVKRHWRSFESISNKKLLKKAAAASSRCLCWHEEPFLFKRVYCKSNILEKHRARGHLTMRHTPGERGRNILNQTGNNLGNWSCRKVALVYLGSRCLGVFTSSRYGCSCCVTAELKGLSERRWLVLRGVWVEGRRGCRSSASIPNDLTTLPEYIRLRQRDH